MFVDGRDDDDDDVKW